MSMPTISDLPTATSVNDSDYTIIRQPGSGIGTDKKTTVANLRNIDVPSYPELTDPQDSDYIIIDRGGTKYKIRFDKVGFKSGTRMWFYQDTAPSGWSSFSSGDTLLAVKGGSTYTIGGSQNGTWQQANATLTNTQIPPHNHIIFGQTIKGGSGFTTRTASANNNNPGLNFVTNNAGGSGGSAQPHNHGNTWRPLASVGIICEKDS